MNSYQSLVNRITELVCENSLNGQNYILIGDNSSGKSEILKNVIEKMLGDEAVYFIDSVNRTFDAKRVVLESDAYENIKYDSIKVVQDRIHPFNFNLQDTFSVATSIEQLYSKYCDQITVLCQLLLKRNIQIERVSIEAGLVENRVMIDGEDTKLSSGYQAILRMLCEIFFFCDAMKEKKWANGFVVIDEIDEYLSPKYCALIFNFLQEQFPQLNFLVTTHSLDLVEQSENAKLIVLRNSSFNIYTTDELKDLVSVDDIFTTLFFEDTVIHKSNDDAIDEKLRLLLNLKIAELWDEKAENDLEVIQHRDLKPHQKMICKQIKEW